MANPAAPDPEACAEAYRLTQPEPIGENMSLAQVALRLGISKSTAGRYVQLAVAHVPYVELMKRARMQGDMAQRLTTMLFETHELAHERRPTSVEEPIDDWKALKEFAAKLEAQLATLLGLNSPSKLDITTNGNGRGKDEDFDPRLVEALERIDARDELDDREIRAGRPGVIEGGSSQ